MCQKSISNHLHLRRFHSSPVTWGFVLESWPKLESFKTRWVSPAQRIEKWNSKSKQTTKKQLQIDKSNEYINKNFKTNPTFTAQPLSEKKQIMPPPEGPTKPTDCPGGEPSDNLTADQTRDPGPAEILKVMPFKTSTRRSSAQPWRLFGFSCKKWPNDLILFVV